ncbi:MAG: radical SAM protein [Parcubacteria group bacterium]
MIKKNKIKMPKDAVVAVTYRCNSRCIMCNIWQIKDFPEMPAEAYRKLPKSLKYINISGGEPFLRNDLVEIVKVIKETCPKANINISTNGFLVDTIKRVLPEIKKVYPKIEISISVDGIGQMHEQVRRVENAWPKVVETIRFCRDILKIKETRLAFTINKENYRQLGLAHEWSKKLGVQFTAAMIHSSDIYFSKENSLEGVDMEHLNKEFDYVIGELIKSNRPTDLAKAYFVHGLYLVAKGERRPLESFAGEDFFYLDPKGDIYPSVVDNIIMGNITEPETFEQIWCSKQADEAREAVKGLNGNYWMVCTARTAYLRNPLKVAKWIFTRKLGIK